MTVTDVEMTDATQEAPLPPFGTVRILQLVKDAQQRHGLRHGDYERYRKYCVKKLKRTRRVLKFTNTHKCVRRHKAKFAKKWMTPEVFNDERFIHIGVFESEKSWATAMSHKITMEDNPDKLRKKASMRMNLKRAVVHAKHLEELIRTSDRCDAPTKLEAQAYTSWLIGICSFELKRWRDASESLKATRQVYEGLAEATHNTTLTNTYLAKCREIQPQLRLCEFNSAETPSEATMSELMAIRMQIGGGEDVDKLIAEVRSKAASDDVVSIEWGGEKATVEDEKLQQVVQGWRQSEKELAMCETPKQKLDLYEKQLADTRDAIERVSDLIKRKSSDNVDTTVLGNIKFYLEFLKMKGTIARYLAIIENTSSEKKSKPQDFLRLYDSIIEHCKEIIELPQAALDKNLVAHYLAKIEFYRAFRCYYVGASYAFLTKYAEAIALFQRADERRKCASDMISRLSKSSNDAETKEKLDALGAQIEQSRVIAKTKRLLESSESMDTSSPSSESVNNKTLLENLSVWRNWELENSPKNVSIVNMPPNFITMPNKPLFFDLALNHVKIPDLQERLAKCAEGAKNTNAPKKGKGASAGSTTTASSAETQESGLGGMVKGWIWGKK